MNDIQQAAALELHAQRMVAEMAGMDIDCDDLAVEAVAAIRAADAASAKAEALAKAAASERRKLVDEVEQRCKAAKKELGTLSRGLRDTLLQYMLHRNKRAAEVAAQRRADLEAMRQAGGDLADLLPDPQPQMTDIEGLTISRRRALAIGDAHALCRAVLSGELPADLLALNDAVARGIIGTGKAMPGVTVTETEHVVIRASAE